MAGLLSTQNDWNIIPSSYHPWMTSFTVNGAKFVVHRKAKPQLKRFVEWFDENIEPVTRDSGGYQFRFIGGTWKWSNHASGTAVDINASQHPWGSRGTFTAAQRAAIREKCNEIGLVWGGDWNYPDEMHFELGFPPGTLPKVLSNAGIWSVWRLPQFVLSGAAAVGLIWLSREALKRGYKFRW